MDRLQEEMTVEELQRIAEEECDSCEFCSDCRFYDCCHIGENDMTSYIEDIINIAKEIKEEKNGI